MRPVTAIVLSENSTRTAKCVTAFDIQAGQLVNPRPVDDKAIDQLTKPLIKKRSKPKHFSGLIPPRTISVEPTSMIFWIPEGEHTVFFGDKVDNKVLLWLPPLLFEYTGPHHRVMVHWMLGSEEALREGKNILLPAPMPNISGGNLCLGSSMDKVKFTPNIALMQKGVVDSFFNSSFNEWRDKFTGPIMKWCIEMALPKNKMSRNLFPRRNTCAPLAKLIKKKGVLRSLRTNL